MSGLHLTCVPHFNKKRDRVGIEGTLLMVRQCCLNVLGRRYHDCNGHHGITALAASACWQPEAGLVSQGHQNSTFG